MTKNSFSISVTNGFDVISNEVAVFVIYNDSKKYTAKFSVTSIEISGIVVHHKDNNIKIRWDVFVKQCYKKFGIQINDIHTPYYVDK